MTGSKMKRNSNFWLRKSLLYHFLSDMALKEQIPIKFLVKILKIHFKVESLKVA
jgi:restriction endonuclease